MIERVGNIDPRVYTGDQAFVTQNFTEANVKRGKQHYITYPFTLASSAVRYIAFNTGDIDTIIKIRNLRMNGGIEYRVFRDSTITAAGTPIPVYNLNDKTPETSLMVVNNAPTVTVDGSMWDYLESYEGHGNQMGGGIFESEGIERVLKKNSTYIAKFTNVDNSAVKVHFVVSWYEGPLSNNI